MIFGFFIISHIYLATSLLTPDQKELMDKIPKNIIIAHRGTRYFTPEQTEVGLRWARNMGADYLEGDMQQSKDGVIVMLHDDNLRRTSNVEDVFPDRASNIVYNFTFEELLKLDMGSWFDENRFSGEQIITLEDMIMVAEGYRLLRRKDLPNKFPPSLFLNEWEGRLTVRSDEIIIPDDLYNEGISEFELSEDARTRSVYIKDEADNGHRPGIYIEIKLTLLGGYHADENDLIELLVRKGWYNNDEGKMKKIPHPPITDDKTRVDIANTDVRCIVQSFNINALRRFQTPLLRLRPLSYLIEEFDGDEMYKTKVNDANDVGVVIIAPGIGKSVYAGYGFNETKGKIVRDAGFLIQPWTFNDDLEIYKSYTGADNPVSTSDYNYLDGLITDRTDVALNFYNYILPEYLFHDNKNLDMENNIHKNKPVVDPIELVEVLGY